MSTHYRNNSSTIPPIASPLPIIIAATCPWHRNYGTPDLGDTSESPRHPCRQRTISTPIKASRRLCHHRTVGTPTEAPCFPYRHRTIGTPTETPTAPASTGLLVQQLKPSLLLPPSDCQCINRSPLPLLPPHPPSCQPLSPLNYRCLSQGSLPTTIPFSIVFHLTPPPLLLRPLYHPRSSFTGSSCRPSPRLH